MKNNKKITPEDLRERLNLPESISDQKVNELLKTLKVLARILIKSGKDLSKDNYLLQNKNENKQK